DLHPAKHARDRAVAALMLRPRREALGRELEPRDLRQPQRSPVRGLAVGAAPYLAATQQLVAGCIDAVDVRSNAQCLSVVVEFQQTLLANRLADDVLHAAIPWA